MTSCTHKILYASKKAKAGSIVVCAASKLHESSLDAMQASCVAAIRSLFSDREVSISIVFSI